MAYTLVGAPALGFDLVRTPSGPNVAEVVLVALSADASTMQALANMHPGSCRPACWDRATAAAATLPRMASVLGAMPTELDLAAAGEQLAGPDLLTRLTGAPLGDLASLEQLIRHEVLDWTWEVVQEVSLQRLRDRMAAEVLCDAAASAFCATVLDDGSRRHLAGPFLSVLRSAPPSSADGLAEVGTLLEGLSTWNEAERREWRSAVDLLRSGTGGWTQAMHDAGWAAHLSGRTRLAAAAQMRAVLAFRSAGLTSLDAAEGSWNALSGVVQAMVVSDLLGDDHLTTLVRPWQVARGSRPGC